MKITYAVGFFKISSKGLLAPSPTFFLNQRLGLGGVKDAGSTKNKKGPIIGPWEESLFVF